MVSYADAKDKKIFRISMSEDYLKSLDKDDLVKLILQMQNLINFMNGV